MSKRFLTLNFFVLFFLITFSAYSQQTVERTINFEFDKYELTPENKINLDSIYSLASSAKDYNISISGFTDSIGTVIYNKALANKRAKTVFSFLVEKGLDTNRLKFTGVGIFTKGEYLSNAESRKAVIVLEIEKQMTYSFYGKNGTEVITEDNIPLSITEYFSTESMLRDSMFAIDNNDNILETFGMIKICKQNEPLDTSGKFYIVRIPARGITNNTIINVYFRDETQSERIRWQLTPVELSLDETNNTFTFKVPINSGRCFYINLDHPCGSQYGNSIVYISIFKPLNFYNMTVNKNSSALSFSAKLNDTSYAFVKHDDDNSNTMKFTGYELQDNKTQLFTASLSTCIYSLDTNKNEHYYICDTCGFHYDLNQNQETTPPPTKKSIQKRKGFFQWFFDLFG